MWQYLQLCSKQGKQTPESSQTHALGIIMNENGIGFHHLCFSIIIAMEINKETRFHPGNAVFHNF